MNVRVARLWPLLVVAGAFGVSERVLAGNDCRPGKMNAAGTCDCPAGYKSTGGAGAAKCESAGPVYTPSCGVPGKPACARPSSTKLPSDAGTGVPFKGGAFVAGDGGGDVADGGPTHSVTLSDFQLDRYEVSVEEYKKCVDSGVCSAPPATMPPEVANAYRCNYGTARTNHPINCVTWQEAANYCTWKGKRLPTEAEWEFAARGPSGRRYPNGATAPTCKEANFTAEDGKPTPGCGDGTAPIGSKDAGKTKDGIYDLSGNVEEWTWDWFANYSGAAGRDPAGPLSGNKRVAKGSSWDLTGADIHIAARREGVEPGRREVWLGFRCAQGPSPSATPAMYVKPSPPPIPTTSPTTAIPLPPPDLGPPAPADLGALIKIPAAKFTMGSVLLTNSQPEHVVTVSSFFIDKYETTVAQYRKCEEAGYCPVPSPISPLCNWGRAGHDNHPINCVDWSAAKKFCAFGGKRLPTEAEWELAARGTDGRTYPWGNANGSCSRANTSWTEKVFCTGVAGDTTVVGQHPMGTSPFGVHDMAGNISEWVHDYFARFDPNPQFNPTGPVSGTDHSVRGGNWEIGDYDSRTYARVPYSGPKYWVGIRCARNAD
jgi:sulfatase modifying factor 1